jgi:hypothetical protein
MMFKKPENTYMLMVTSMFIVAVFCLWFSESSAATANFSWLPNQENDLAGYKIHYGQSAGSYDQVVDVGLVQPGDDGRCHYTMTNAPDTMTYYAATAYDQSGTESDFSSEISADLSPDAPADFKVISVNVTVTVQ